MSSRQMGSTWVSLNSKESTSWDRTTLLVGYLTCFIFPSILFKAGKRDFWLMDYENMEEAYFLTILRDDFFRSTMVQVDMKYIGVNDSFVCCLEEILRPGPVLDYSVLYERLIKLDTVKQKRDETIGFIESIVEIYGQT